MARNLLVLAAMKTSLIKNEYLFPSRAIAVREVKPTALPCVSQETSSFAEQMIQAKEKLGVRTEAPAMDAPITQQDVAALLVKLQRQMNESLMRMLTDDDESDTKCLPLYGRAFPATTVEATEPSGIRPLFQNNDALPPLSQDLEDIINDAAAAYGVDADLIRSVIKAESNFEPNSTSSRGAQGLMQLMPATARELGVADPYDPRQNIMGGVRYLRILLDRYHGDQSLTLAAYNWGMGNVEKYPGRLPRETQAYISRVTEYLQAAKA